MIQFFKRVVDRLFFRLIGVAIAGETGDSSHVLKRRNMEKAEQFLQLSREESESVSSLGFHPHRVGVDSSFYEHFALRGIRVDRVKPGLVSCSFKVPPRHTDELEITSKVLGQRGSYSGTNYSASEEQINWGTYC